MSRRRSPCPFFLFLFTFVPLRPSDPYILSPRRARVFAECLCQQVLASIGHLPSSQKKSNAAHDKRSQFRKILKINQGASCDSGHFPATSLLPLVLQTTPLAPQVPPGSTPIDGGGILLFLDFRHFRPLAPHTRPPRTLYVRSTTDPTPKASLSPLFSI